MAQRPEFDPRRLDALARRLSDSLPRQVQALGLDLETHFREVLKTAFRRLDLVTREEFEVQKKVLARTREKLDALEARLRSGDD